MIRSLVSLSPASELQQVADLLDRAFGEMREAPVNGEQETGQPWKLPVDIYERDNSVVVRAAVPGIKPEELEVTVEKNTLSIKGETKSEWAENDKVYRREYRYGCFARSIRLPEDIDTERVSAEFENGFVKITLPRVEPVKPKSVKIEVKTAPEIIHEAAAEA